MLPEDRDSIIALCMAHEEQNWKKIDYRAAIVIGTQYFVKYGSISTMTPEAAAHRFVSDYAAAQTDPNTPRIPKVEFYFTDETNGYLVIEYVEIAGPLEPQATMAALRWLATVPLPDNHVFGPLSGGKIQHPFFQDHCAPLNFSSVDALERYIEKGRLRLPAGSLKIFEPVGIADEPCMWSQADLHPSNFARDVHGKPLIMDFAEIAPLPQSFVMFAILSTPRLEPLASLFGVANEANIETMRRVCHLLWMMGDARLGLNSDGFEVVKETLVGSFD